MFKNSLLQTLTKSTKSFYIIAGVTFIIWLVFFDNNNLFFHYEMKEKLELLDKQKRFYQTEIQTIEKEMSELKNDSRTLEKFAREKYFFKKKGEDIYIIEK